MKKPPKVQLSYPRIISELDTLELAIAGRCLGRLGDGEIRLAFGGRAASQEQHPRLRAELQEMIQGKTYSLTCLPNLYSPSPHMWFWEKYKKHPFVNMLRWKDYGSTWITRPDCAPWIDTPDYWHKVTQLWHDRDVTLVTGDEKSLTPKLMTTARSIKRVTASRQHAYAEIQRVEEEIGRPSGPILMCLGATATVLAERLARKGLWAIDLGHLGMFMRRREEAAKLVPANT